MERFPTLLFVALGGSAGAVARFLLGEWIAARSPRGFPWGTFAVNVTGCLAAGFLLALLEARDPGGRAWKALLAVGFLGAYTTFSTFSWETLALAREGSWGRAAIYASTSLAVGLLAAGAGIAAARTLA
jgi:CrcB protein